MASKLAGILEQIAKLEQQAKEIKATEITDLKQRHLDELRAAGLTFEEVWGKAKQAKPATEKTKTTSDRPTIRKMTEKAAPHRSWGGKGAPSWARTSDNKVDKTKLREPTPEEIAADTSAQAAWDAKQPKK